MRLSADKTSPKVSVCVVTYNHEKYIRRCLQSLVDQVTDFAFEVIVGEDCSTDDTRAIVREFSEGYPDMVKPIFHEKNVGACRNVVMAHARAAGEYVAHVDGDDYALPGKLQKQADFLDRNPHCSFACHRVELIAEDGRALGLRPEGRRPPFTDIEDLIRNYIFFAHSSKMYRRSAAVFDHTHKVDLIDFYVHVEHASQGLIGFLPDVLGGCHRNSGGVTNAVHQKLYWLIDMTLAGYDRAAQLGVRKEVVDYGKAKYLVGAAAICLARSDPDGFQKYLVASRIGGRYFSFANAVVFGLRNRPALLRTLLRLRALKAALAAKLRR